jgi:hypothetical protein
MRTRTTTTTKTTTTTTTTTIFVDCPGEGAMFVRGKLLVAEPMMWQNMTQPFDLRANILRSFC